MVRSSNERLGHVFHKKTFRKPTHCHHCTDMLWGIVNQGSICRTCNFVTHDRCMSVVRTPCSSIAASLVKDSVAHTWSKPGKFRKDFCNVCRRRLEDRWAVRCEGK
jgi:diacylglycerol kinase (ATP)